MTTLAEVDVFQDFTPAGLERLTRLGRLRTVGTGEALCRQGAHGGAMYVILRGRVRTERAHPDLSEPVTVVELGPGESVGELGVLDLTPWPTTATALEETDALELSALLLAETLLRYPVPAIGLLSSLSRSLRSLDDLERCVQRLRAPPQASAADS
jgi:CRP-like cAMP-binding protein